MIDRFLFGKIMGQFAPTTTRFHYVEDGIEDFSVRDLARRSAFARGCQQWRNMRIFGVIQVSRVNYL